jgi:tetratricopeptide (TPR) repeat protein
VKRVLGLVALLVAGICEGGSDLRVEDCLAAVRARPDDQESYRCFFVAARREQLWSESIAALETLLAEDADNPRAMLALGSIESDRRRPRAEELFSQAAERFADTGDLQGEVDARLGLANFLASRARYDEQREQIENSLRLARTGDDIELLTAALLAYGSYFTWASRLDLAEDVFAELPDLAEINPLLRARAHRSLALHDWFSGRLDSALTHYRTAAGLYADNGDRFMEASTLYNVTLTTSKLVTRGNATQEQLDETLDATLRAAVAGGNQQTRAQVLLMIGQAPHRPLAERIPVVEEALAIHRSMGTYKEACFATR